MDLSSSDEDEVVEVLVEDEDEDEDGDGLRFKWRSAAERKPARPHAATEATATVARDLSGATGILEAAYTISGLLFTAHGRHRLDSNSFVRCISPTFRSHARQQYSAHHSHYMAARDR